METVANARIEEIKSAIIRGENGEYTLADYRAAWVDEVIHNAGNLWTTSRTLDIIDTVVSVLEDTEECYWEDLAHETADNACVYYSTGYEWLNGESDSDEFCDEWLSEYCCDKPEDFNSIVMGGYYCWVRTIAESVIAYVQGK